MSEPYGIADFRSEGRETFVDLINDEFPAVSRMGFIAAGANFVKGQILESADGINWVEAANDAPAKAAVLQHDMDNSTGAAPKEVFVYRRGGFNFRDLKSTAAAAPSDALIEHLTDQNIWVRK